MKIAILDAGTLGDDISLNEFEDIGQTAVYEATGEDEVAQRLRGVHIAVLNKVKLKEENLVEAEDLRLICITATGFDNVDVDYCRKNGIAVCNVKGYSTDSVAQLTVAMALYLANNLSIFNAYVHNGSYSASGMQNRVVPAFHELRGKVWGIVGYGNIGKQVAAVAQALGCEILAFRKNPEGKSYDTGLEQLMEKSDIVSVHLPLNESTKNIIDRKMIGKMKKSAIIINVARGGVWDEEAVAAAVINKSIYGIGCDVYSTEPMDEGHPFAKLCGMDNVCLTPHTAWGAREARQRCIDEIIKNIDAFMKGERRNRVD